MRKQKVFFVTVLLVLSSIVSALDLQPVIDRVHRDGLYDMYLRKLSTTSTRVVSYGELKHIVAKEGFHVVVVGGYSGLGYQDPETLTKLLRTMVDRIGDNTLYVLGATSDGIGIGYTVIPARAKENGFHNVRMAGIVSRNAAEWGIAPQDYVVFVDTDPYTWDVIEDGKSLYIGIAAETGHGKVIYFRGGETSGHEIQEACEKGVETYLVITKGTEPNSENVRKKKAKNPDYIIDGTIQFVKDQERYPSLTILR